MVEGIEGGMEACVGREEKKEWKSELEEIEGEL
jgi:hypothetical protein